MKIVFVSNYFNHHQMPISDELFKTLGNNNYHFIETEPMSDERVQLGWHGYERPYLIKLYSQTTKKSEIERIINEADVVVAGSAPFELIKDRVKVGKLTFYYSERLFKSKLDYLKYFKWYFSFRKRYGKNVYILCSSAYASADYKLLGLYQNKCYKWGYFPQVINYDKDSFSQTLSVKKNNSFIWVGRFIKWKHADDAIKVIRRLKTKYNVSLEMIGSGPLKQKYQDYVKKCGLSSNIKFCESISPEDVRKRMEESKFFLFTSDYNEGWGAVLNEAMNSACISFANCAAGSTTFLIQDNHNGVIYPNRNIEYLEKCIIQLIDNEQKANDIALNSYSTIKNIWSPQIAAERLIALSNCLLRGEQPDTLYDSGPCSVAEIRKNHWFKRSLK